MTSWYYDEPAILRELKRGREAQLEVANMLRALGFEVELEEQLVRRTGGHGPEWIEEQDLRVEGEHVLEVKGRDLNFFDPSDFPFPTIYVGNVERWRQRQEPVCSVVVFSEHTKRVIAVPLATRPLWRPAYPYDKTRGSVQCSYEVDKAEAQSWKWLVDHLWGSCA